MRRAQILVAVDETDAAAAAVRLSGAIASALGGEVTVLHVHEPGKDGRYDDAPETRALRVLAERGIVAEVNARAGDPPSEILSAAATLKPDLLVMGSRGRSTMTGMLLGSVSQQVLSQAKCPVLLVRAGTAMIHAPYTILLAVEGTAGMEPVLRMTARLARALSARVVVVHVSYPGGEELEKDLYHATQTHGEQALSAATAVLTAAGVAVETQSLPSTSGVSHAIAKYADQVGADLIVMGRHHPPAAYEPARTGQAVSVSHLSNRPVLVTAEDAGAR